MKRLFLSIFLTSLVCSQAILHSPVEQATEQTPILIETFIDLPDYEIKRVTLFFREKGEVKYIESPMFKIDIEYLGEIPANFVQVKGVEYFVVVDTYDMGFIGLPNVNPTNNPFSVEINKKKKINNSKLLSEFNPKYTILSPDIDSEIIDDDMFISISYFEMDNIDPEKTKIFLNNEDISEFVDFKYNHFVYYPEEPKIGLNNIKVILIDDFGIEYNPIEWGCTVVRDEDISFFNFKQSGKVKTDYSSSIVDTTSFSENTIDFIYNAKFDWLDLRLNSHISSLENALDQPKNRFFADFRSESFRLRLGDVYPNFGENFIKRNRVRGMDFNFNADKYLINFVSGEINRATQGDSFSESMLITDILVDSLYNDDGSFSGLDSPSFNINRDNYSFSRKLTALQVKFPIKKNMNLSFNILKAKDNISSVYRDVPNAIISLPSNLNSYIENPDYIFSSDSTFTTYSDTTFFDNGAIESIDEIADTSVVNYIKYSDLKSNYLDFFNSVLTGEKCIDSDGNILDNFSNQADCEDSGATWIASGICYELDDNGEEVVNESIIIESNCISLDGIERRWEPFFEINFLNNQWTGMSPKDNLVIGSEFESFFDRERLKFTAGISFSLLNENTWDPVLTYASLDTLGGDPEDGSLAGYEIPENLDLSKYESIFQSGINQVPLLPLDIISGKSNLLKIFTMPSLAYYISLEGDYYGHKVAYKFKQIGPEYNSLGNVYLQQDIREQTISDRISLLDNKLYLNLKYKLLEEGVSFENQEKGKTNKFDILINFSPGAGLARLSSAIGYQNRTNGVTSNDFIDYQLDDFEEKIDIDSRKENSEILQFNFALTTPVVFYGNHNLTISYYNSLTDDLVADENILYSFESDSTYDAFPYISPRSETNTVNLNLKSAFNPFISTSANFSRTFFDYGLDISHYYKVLDDNEDTFTLDSDYDYDIALSNINRFNDSYGDILYQKQILNSMEFQLILNSYLIFDTIKLGANLSNASGVVEFQQYGVSMSLIKYIFENFYMSFDYDRKFKDIDGGDVYDNSYSFLRLGYEF
tara:strand:- start:67 stop:3204 length:3138 start_codon:yes stop_codon:yes gene_type:complete